MAKLTTAQMKERQLERFNNELIHDMETARKIVNSFNRLCGLCDRLLILENDEYFHNKRYTKELQESEARRINNLNKVLKSYGVQLAWSGHIPTISEVDSASHCIGREFLRWIPSSNY